MNHKGIFLFFFFIISPYLSQSQKNNLGLEEHIYQLPFEKGKNSIAHAGL